MQGKAKHGKTKLKEALEEVINDITPSSEELKRAESAAGKLVSRLNKPLKSLKAKAIIAGSSKKGTQLKGVFEIDVFVLFNYKKYSDNDKEISDILEGVLKKTFKNAIRLHGSRDYFQIKTAPYTFEIVPILEIKSSKQAKNITDVSPLHAKWVARHSKNRLAEIRLTKAFLSALNIYGAESYVRGFSGYACEVLAIHYSSFVNLLKSAAKWREKQVIDPERFYKSRNPLFELNKSKTLSPLVLIDPVQPSRNVTAALSKEAFTAFKKAAAKFLKRPSKSFFTKKIVTKQDLINKTSKHSLLLILELIPVQNKRDVMGAAILRKYELVKNKLAEHLFKIIQSSWEWKGKKAILWFYISKRFPSKYEYAKGPVKSDSANSSRFKQKHKRVFVRAARLYSKEKRKFPSPQPLVKFIMKQNNFKSRIKRVKAEWHLN